MPTLVLDVGTQEREVRFQITDDGSSGSVRVRVGVPYDGLSEDEQFHLRKQIKAHLEKADPAHAYVFDIVVDANSLKYLRMAL